MKVQTLITFATRARKAAQSRSTKKSDAGIPKIAETLKWTIVASRCGADDQQQARSDG
jgi:hypothetical protein